MRMSRRQVLRVAGAASIASVGGLLSRRSWAQGERVLVISSWGGSFQEGMRKAYFDPFTKESGIKVIENNYGAQGLARLKAQVEAGRVEVDLIDSPPQWPVIGRKRGIIQPIDSRSFDAANLVPGAIQEYAFGFTSVSWGMTYNTKAFAKKEPGDWADFWNVKGFPGRRAFSGASILRHIEYALMADGVPAGEVNPLSMEKVERAFRKLTELRPHVSVFYPSIAQAQQLLTDEEVVMSEFTHGRTAVLATQGAPVAFQFNQALLSYTWWILAKNAPNKENALRFLSFISQATPQAEMARASYYGPTNKKAFDLIKDEQVLKFAPTHPDYARKQVLLDGEWWGENEERLADRWRAWVAGK